MSELSLRVLIADDQPDVLEALRLLLKGEGYDIEAATTPAGVVKAIPQPSTMLWVTRMNSM